MYKRQVPDPFVPFRVSFLIEIILRVADNSFPQLQCWIARVIEGCPSLHVVKLEISHQLTDLGQIFIDKWA